MLVTWINKIACGHSHSGAIDENGKLYMWGANPDTRCFKKIEYYKLSLRPKSIVWPHLIKALEYEKFVDLQLAA